MDKNTKKRLELAKKMREDLKQYIDYIECFGNECAYTDRMTEAIFDSAEEIKNSIEKELDVCIENIKLAKISVETKLGTMMAYASPDKDNPGICVMFTPAGEPFLEIDLLSAEVQSKDLDEDEKLHLYMWGDPYNEDFTHKETIKPSDLLALVVGGETPDEHKHNIVADYTSNDGKSGWKIFHPEALPSFLVLHNLDDEEYVRVKEIFRINNPEFEQMSDQELLDACSEIYDYSGELFDGSAYCYWNIV